tara:strand:+ start:155 stop:499 length:345 start_codon:yes stop_codon:yes gene_type:complete
MEFSLLTKAVIASSILVSASWLAENKPEVAGFIIALPLVSIIALVFGQIQHGDDENSIVFAKSIFIGVPISYVFFLPFFLPAITRYGFWPTLTVGISLLGGGYFLHQFFIAKIT